MLDELSTTDTSGASDGSPNLATVGTIDKSSEPGTPTRCTRLQGPTLLVHHDPVAIRLHGRITDPGDLGEFIGRSKLTVRLAVLDDGPCPRLADTGEAAGKD